LGQDNRIDMYAENPPANNKEDLPAMDIVLDEIDGKIAIYATKPHHFVIRIKPIDMNDRMGTDYTGYKMTLACTKRNSLWNRETISPVVIVDTVYDTLKFFTNLK